ncbi:MAG: hypothetical protein N3D20_01030 [Candidatus Pacearchaeota archaeon]|nr:hypothetical protein [Candidatus Pacearchaeota archaeon]
MKSMKWIELVLIIVGIVLLINSFSITGFSILEESGKKVLSIIGIVLFVVGV